MKKVIMLAFCLILLASCQKAEPEIETGEPLVIQTNEVKAEKIKTEVKEIETEDLFTERYPFAIMINNHPDARPQSGLTQAKIIYEMEVEGRITRLLMIIDKDDDTLIGPVRSARPSYLNLVKEFDAIYSHVGNSKYVTSDIRDFDQFYYGANAYYRSDHRYAPHNVYARMNDLYSDAMNTGYTIDLPEEGLDHFKVYKEDKKIEGGTKFKSVAFTYDNYTNLVYKYDEELGGIVKEINGTVLTEEFTGEPMVIKNFFIISQEDLGYMPNGVHRRIEYVGEGDATYYTQGKKFDVTWKKESDSAPLKFYMDGKEIVLQPGLTYVNFIFDYMDVEIE